MANPLHARNVKSRGGRRAVWFAPLSLLAVLLSFALGYWFGLQRSAAVTVAESPQTSPAVQVSVPPRPALQETTTPENLSFYDNLPKGEQAPLGSGINLPLETGADKAHAAKPSEAVAASPVVSSPRPSAVTGPAQSDPDGSFLVQVASFKTEEDAGRLTVRLQKKGVQATIERADLGDRGVWYRVIAGPYTERLQAEQVSALLKSEERLSALVRSR